MLNILNKCLQGVSYRVRPSLIALIIAGILIGLAIGIGLVI